MSATAARIPPASLLLGTASIAAVLLAVVLLPQMFSRQARLEVLRNHVHEVARVTASVVDGDLHRTLLEGGVDEATRQQALQPLLKLHRNWPEAVYVYTMGVRDGIAYFILDSAQDASLAAERGLRASEYLEPFHLRDEYDGNWLDVLAAGHTYVNRTFQHDDYGFFLSGHAPIRDSTGQITGFAGVDFDLDYHLREEARFRGIEVISILCTLLLSLLLGYLYARYRQSHRVALQQHVELSMQDSLTGLPNRRGALAAMESAWGETAAVTHAALLVDIDNFKSINDTHGHAAGDGVIMTLKRVLQDVLRPGDFAARIGGDEFMIFARNCDLAGAKGIATRLLRAVESAPDAPLPFTVSVGVSTTLAAEGSFDALYRRADSALYAAKRGGRNRQESAPAQDQFSG